MLNWRRGGVCESLDKDCKSMSWQDLPKCCDTVIGGL